MTPVLLYAAGEASQYSVPLKFEVRSQQGLIGSKIEGGQQWLTSTDS